jgi:6-phosphofructokinase 1
MELYHDATVYDTKQITIVEVMGRNAGWLTAAAALAQSKGQGPDLIYLPELPFDFDEFFTDVQKVLSEKGKVIVAVSEGIKTKDGKYIPELFQELRRDAFGHAQLGGAAQALANEISNRIDVKVRAIEFSLLQRSAAHLASKVDVEEAYKAGRKAVQAAVKGTTDKMVGFKRVSNNPYKIKYVLLPLKNAANHEQTVPLEWILPRGKGMTQEFIDYALPLIQGESKAKLEDGLPRFARLKKVRVAKK